MSDIDLVIRATRRLENLLTTRFGAQGRGLHAKISDVAAQLPGNSQKGLRWVATMRNRVVHQEGFRLKNPKDFKAEVTRLERALGRSTPGWRFATAIVVLVAGAIAWSILKQG